MKEVYILLSEGDVIQEGDEFFVTRILGWTKASDIGMKIDPRYPYRRKVSLPLWQDVAKEDLKDIHIAELEKELLELKKRLKSSQDDRDSMGKHIFDLYDRIEKLNNLASNPPWPEPIRFQDKMPEEGQRILALGHTYKDCEDFIGSMKVESKEHLRIISGTYTHWFPQPPKPEAKEEKVEEKETWHDSAREDIQAIERQEAYYQAMEKAGHKTASQPKSGEEPEQMRKDDLDDLVKKINAYKSEVVECGLEDILAMIGEIVWRLKIIENKTLQ